MADSLDKRILLDRLSHVRYGHPDLGPVKQFFIDFGLTVVKESEEEIFFRGFGRDPFIYVAEKTHDGKRKFKGGAWIVQSMAELEKASKMPGASAIKDAWFPGGGKVVIVQDIMGEPITLLYDQQDRQAEPRDIPNNPKWNTWEEKRRLGEFQRPGSNHPSRIHKLGHYGFEVNNTIIDSVTDWYTTTFNLKKTDSLIFEETEATAMDFIHLDKGEEFVDHHNIFIAAGKVEKGIKAHHISFEVDDVDSQLVGHHYLKRNGYNAVFGVGRHILGSQIFDYWFDPSGFLVEHYADGDLVNCNTPHGKEPAIAATVASWGPDIPKAFFSKKLEDIPGIQNPPPMPIEA